MKYIIGCSITRIEINRHEFLAYQVKLLNIRKIEFNSRNHLLTATSYFMSNLIVNRPCHFLHNSRLAYFYCRCFTGSRRIYHCNRISDVRHFQSSKCRIFRSQCPRFLNRCITVFYKTHFISIVRQNLLYRKVTICIRHRFVVQQPLCFDSYTTYCYIFRVDNLAF